MVHVVEPQGPFQLDEGHASRVGQRLIDPLACSSRPGCEELTADADAPAGGGGGFAGGWLRSWSRSEVPNSSGVHFFLNQAIPEFGLWPVFDQIPRSVWVWLLYEG